MPELLSPPARTHRATVQLLASALLAGLGALLLAVQCNVAAPFMLSSAALACMGAGHLHALHQRRGTERP